MTGATDPSATGADRLTGFNPRPGHVTGATTEYEVRDIDEYVSIRAPAT